MKNILRQHRILIAVTLLIEAGICVGLVMCRKLFPDFEYYFYGAIGMAELFILFSAIVGFVFNYRISRVKGKTELTSAEIMGNELNEAYNFGQIGLIVASKDNEILWINDFMSQRYPDIIDKQINEVFPALKFADDKAPTAQVRLPMEGHVYDVEFIRDVRLYVFKDVTELDSITSLNQNQAPVIGYLTIDNYYDIQVNVQDEAKFGDMVSKARGIINDFSHTYSAMLKSIKEDRYFFIMTKENFDKLEADRFPLVDQIRTAYTNNSGFTVSMGISYGFDDYAKLSDLASAALDVALSRGGDQTVVSPFGRALSYFGGKTELRPTENRVKLRTTSNALLTVLRSYKKVLIMGHMTADFDAIAASLGAYLLCRHIGIPAKICWEDQLIEDKCRVAVKSNFRKEEMDTIFIDYKNLLEWVDDDTLLFMVDHNNPRIAMFPELIKKMSNRIAIVDHHRPTEVVVNNPVFSSIDTSASSASELFTDYIKYSIESIAVDSRTATFLLSGIALDTHFFKEKASSATFEAAATLRADNADGGKVDDFLKENLEEYRQKIAIMNNSTTPYYGTLVCVSPDTDIVNPVLLSIVATDAIRIRGISCSFAIGRTGEHEIKVSARSDGSVNCQLIMEKMGGGGHFAMAAAAFLDTSVEAVRKRLNQVLADYLNDARVQQ